MKNGSSGSLADSSESVTPNSSSPAPMTDAQIIEAIEQEIEKLDLPASREADKYFSGFREMAALVRKRYDLINDRLFHLVFMYIKAYFEDTKDKKCIELLNAVLRSGNQYDVRNLELVFLWAIQNEMADVLDSLLFQPICFIRDFPLVCFEIFINLQKMPKFLESLLFTRWSEQTSDAETLSKFKQLFEYTARKGTPEMLGCFLIRGNFLNNTDSIMTAIKKAILEDNVPNVVFLWRSEYLDPLCKQAITTQLVQGHNIAILKALQNEEDKNAFYENFIFRVTQMVALGGLTTQNADIILGMVEAYVAVFCALNELDSNSKRAYYINLGLELLEQVRKISKKARKEAQKSQGVSQEFLKLLDAPAQPPLPSAAVDETYTPMRTLSNERLQEQSLEQLRKKLGQITLEDDGNQKIETQAKTSNLG